MAARSNRRKNGGRPFVTTAQRLIARNLAPREAIKAICCSTQGEGTVPVDRDGKALMNCILWMDMRGAPYLHQTSARLDQRRRR